MTSSNSIDVLVDIVDEEKADRRFCVLSYEQVKRLNDLMSEVIPIHGRGNFPTIDVKLCDLVSVVKNKLDNDGVKVNEIRLNGSGASSVLAADFASADVKYNDLDLIFSVDLTSAKAYDRVKVAVLESLMELLPEGVSRKRMSSCSLKEAYVSKMVKVNDSGDRWSLISLGNNRAKTVELKFVDTMRRQYEFSVDSFHVMLDTLFLYYEATDADTPMSDNFYPTVVGESMYGEFRESLYHLHKKLIATRNPEEIRGGGLLKYCNLLCRGYRPAQPGRVKSMERYMCSRFFIDFPDLGQQQAKLDNYLINHFQSSKDNTKYEYLMILYQVVSESTVCLMGHERRLTLSMIEDMAYQVYCPTPTTYYEADNHQNLNLLSPSPTITPTMAPTIAPTITPTITPAMSPTLSTSCTSLPACEKSMSSASSTCSDMSMASPTSSRTATPILKVQTPTPSASPASIPTYEIVTSCQPAVVFSNGYYYTSFVSPPPTNSPTSVGPTVVTMASCMACSCHQWQAVHQTS